VNHVVQELVLPSSSHDNNNPNSTNNRTTDTTNSRPFPPLIQVHNLVVGGTSTLPVHNYWLSEAFAPDGADVVLNDYSANDNYPAYDHFPENTTVDYYHTWTAMQYSEKFLATSTLSAQSSTSSLSPPGSSSSFCTDPHNDKRQGQQQSMDSDTTTTTTTTSGTAIKTPPSFPVTYFIDSYVENARPLIIGKGTLQETTTLLAR
jgi:hypothetical protein